jgi:hypothetical protein
LFEEIAAILLESAIGSASSALIDGEVTALKTLATPCQTTNAEMPAATTVNGLRHAQARGQAIKKFFHAPPRFGVRLNAHFSTLI